ncbi:transmembrane protein 131-like isoform X1 [Anguilla anguilla]|uniref:transmembrane protein 131-like isoform X1 n=1 Tax=Anguilla anguilla TaxID=7936 RepID=UPI0015ACC2F4|nr:transmembrane protein 131-like isoform X1 [Anguilla anguilla]
MAGLRDTQQGSHRHRKTWINLLFGILHLLLPCVRQGRAQSQALAQMSSVVEVWQAEEADVIFPTQSEEERHREGFSQEGSSFYVQESGRALRFQPSVLEFGTQPLGLPRAETIYINNPSQDQPVTLLSIFTSSGHFHIPSFHRRVIPPRGKASFKLIFLPTEEGNVENTLFINTSSHGVLSYQVFGVGVHHGPYKDLQIKHSQLIFPHIQSIKLTQTQDEASNMTILGLQLECSLPKTSFGHPQGSSCLLTDEKLVVKISLSERGEKHTGLERFKPYVIENIVVLFEITSGRSRLWEPKMNIYMLNSGGKKLYVKDVQVLSEMEGSVEFRQAPLSTSASNFTQVASLVCRGSLPERKTEFSSRISAHVLDRSTLKTYPAFDLTHRRFGKSPPLSFHVTRRQSGGNYADLWLTSGFDFAFTVNHATVSPDMDGLLKVVNFSGPATVPSGCWRLLSLHLAGGKAPANALTTAVLLTDLGVPLEIPLHVHSSVSKGDLPFEARGECGSPCQLRLSDTAGRVQWQESRLLEGRDDDAWRVDSTLASELYSHWRKSKDQHTCMWPRLSADPGSPLDFGATPVNESKLKYFTLKNPSASPVSVELLPLSSYSAPLEALDLLTKWFKMNPRSVNVSTAEFTLQTVKPQEGRRGAKARGPGSVRVHLGPWESREIRVLFTPAEHKPVTSLILIRNNLTVLDMVTVKGHGAREMLRVGGKLPGGGASLRFSVPQSTLMDCRDGEREGLRPAKPLFAITKSFKLENAGELPLTIVSMNINGYKCQGFGFEVLECGSFQLDYNSSSEINIAFTPDFTSSWVIRDLTLVTGRGSSFSFTLNVTLPHHMLPLCAQVVPGPSWEEAFWLFTLVFTCLSLSGVCLLAFRQAQYILADFSTPSPRANHSPPLHRDNGSVDTISPNTASKTKGSCKAFADTCNASDKGKGKGSPSVAGGPARTPPSSASSKKGPSAPAQPQKKHKVSVYYGKYKASPAAAAAAAAAEEEREEPAPCGSGGDGGPPAAAEPPTPPDKEVRFEEEARASAGEPPAVMFPVETRPALPKETAAAVPDAGPVTCGRAAGPAGEDAPAPWLRSPLSRLPERKLPEKREGPVSEVREDSEAQRRPVGRVELGDSAPNNKGKKNGNKNRRKPEEGVAGVPEHTVVMLPEKNRALEWRESRNPNRSRNRCSSRKADGPKLAMGANQDCSPAQLQNGACPGRPRRRGAERRPQWESGSDSGSSSGSAPAGRGSRGSWGSWSSASSLEGEKDHGARAPCATSAPPNKRESVQQIVYPIERDLAPTCSGRAQSMQNLYQKDPYQVPDPAPEPGSAPSFAAMAACRERPLGVPCVTEETWAPPSVPLNTDLRHNAAQTLPLLPPGSPSGFYHSFPWNSVNSKCTSAYPYCEPSSYMLGAHSDFQNGFLCQENPNVSYSPKSCWSEDRAQEMPSVWDSTGTMGTKPFFGTRSLSPMSGLFGSIWTPQSEPYQSHLQPDHAVPPPPQASVSRQPGGTHRPKQYSTFNPFGPHMNLDIWNSSSNRSSNSQLSSDSGYCADM